MIRRDQIRDDTRFYPPIEVVERRSTESAAVHDPVVRRATAYMMAHLGNLSGLEDTASVGNRLHGG